MMPKKKTSKKSVRSKMLPPKIKAFTLRMPEADLDWLDTYCAEIGVSRQRMITTILKGVQLADSETGKQGSFMQFYTDQVSSLVMEAMEKKRK